MNMNKIYKFFITLVCLFVLGGFCFAENSNDENGVKVIQKDENYKIYIPPVVGLDTRASLEQDEINIIDKKKFNALLKYKRIFTREINTIDIKYSAAWIQKLQNVAREIRKYPNTIVIIEGFRNTELTERENIFASKKHALFVASILRDIYRVKNTMAAIGRGIEKNEDLNYNCVIISLIKNVNPSDKI